MGTDSFKTGKETVIDNNSKISEEYEAEISDFERFQQRGDQRGSLGYLFFLFNAK